MTSHYLHNEHPVRVKNGVAEALCDGAWRCLDGFCPASPEALPVAADHFSAANQLMLRAAEGDEAAFAELAGRIRPALVRFLRGRMRQVGRDPGDAEDAAQDVLLKLLQKARAGEFEPKEDFGKFV